LTGFLDQSWWPDGEYTAPTDEALKFDLQIVKDLGMNVIRLHQARIAIIPPWCAPLANPSMAAACVRPGAQSGLGAGSPQPLARDSCVC
jgi:hypothetical protein